NLNPYTETQRAHKPDGRIINRETLAIKPNSSILRCAYLVLRAANTSRSGGQMAGRVPRGRRCPVQTRGTSRRSSGGYRSRRPEWETGTHDELLELGRLLGWCQPQPGARNSPIWALPTRRTKGMLRDDEGT